MLETKLPREPPNPLPVAREMMKARIAPITALMRAQMTAKSSGFRKSPSLRMLLKKFTGFKRTSRAIRIKLGTSSL
jgi:hypothetical protein